MRLSKIFKNTLLVLMACIVLTACATKKEVETQTTTSASTTTEAKTETEKADPIEPIAGQMQGDVYTGTDTVEYLADGVPDRVFFATNESILTTASRETLRAQAACFLKVSLDLVVSTDSFVAKNTLSGTPSARYFTVSVPV